ncbi:hypothetical protein CR513_52911, partial [Mucuna pruriens]
MESLLYAKDLWNLAENSFKEPRLLKNARTKDHKIKHYLFMATNRSIFEQILNKHTSKIKSLLNSLRREFEVCEMCEAEIITNYFVGVIAVVIKIKSNRKDMLDLKRWRKYFKL